MSNLNSADFPAGAPKTFSLVPENFSVSPIHFSSWNGGARPLQWRCTSATMAVCVCYNGGARPGPRFKMAPSLSTTACHSTIPHLSTAHVVAP